MDFIEESKAVVEGHFVYKAGYAHGNLYINKEKFPTMGAQKLVQTIYQVVINALKNGLSFGTAKKIGIIGPAYGAIPFSLTLAVCLEEQIPGILFFPAHTELAIDQKTGLKYHIIPDKLKSDYQDGTFIIHEDIVNNGTTTREVANLFREKVNARIIAATCFVDRIGQTAESLGVEQYYPLFVKIMKQYDIRTMLCPLCRDGVPITTDIGKGKEWVTMFGHPPYPEGKYFAAFWT